MATKKVAVGKEHLAKKKIYVLLGGILLFLCSSAVKGGTTNVYSLVVRNTSTTNNNSTSDEESLELSLSEEEKELEEILTESKHIVQKKSLIKKYFDLIDEEKSGDVQKASKFGQLIKSDVQKASKFGELIKSDAQKSQELTEKIRKMGISTEGGILKEFMITLLKRGGTRYSSLSLALVMARYIYVWLEEKVTEEESKKRQDQAIHYLEKEIEGEGALITALEKHDTYVADLQNPKGEKAQKGSRFDLKPFIYLFLYYGPGLTSDVKKKAREKGLNIDSEEQGYHYNNYSTHLFYGCNKVSIEPIKAP